MLLAMQAAHITRAHSADEDVAAATNIFDGTNYQNKNIAVCYSESLSA